MKREKVFSTKSMIIFIVFEIVLLVGFILLMCCTEDILYGVVALAFLILVTLAFRFFEKQKTIKIFRGEKFERIGMVDKYTRIILIIVLSILVILLIAIAFVSEEDVIVPLLLSLLLFHQILTNIVYASKDILVYNNTVMQINRIDYVEKESKKLCHHICYIENGKCKRMKVGNKQTRDRIYALVKERM